jgi:hypothetical protein
MAATALPCIRGHGPLLHLFQTHTAFQNGIVDALNEARAIVAGGLPASRIVGAAHGRDRHAIIFAGMARFYWIPARPKGKL